MNSHFVLQVNETVKRDCNILNTKKKLQEDNESVTSGKNKKEMKSNFVLTFVMFNEKKNAFVSVEYFFLLRC